MSLILQEENAAIINSLWMINFIYKSYEGLLITEENKLSVKGNSKCA